MPFRSFAFTPAMTVLVAALALLSLSGCGNDGRGEQVNPPFSSSQLEGKNYKEVVARFQEAGFINVTAEPIPDLILGWLTVDGEVEDVIIGDRAAFDTGGRFEPDVAVVVRYHTFPEEDSPSPSPTPSTEGAPSATSSLGGDTPASASTPQATAPAPVAAPATSDVLTAANNADLAALLALKNPSDPSVESFASTYKGRTIEFDGCVAYVSRHGSYKTRFDYLLSAGDYDPDDDSGPSFQYANINYYDFHFPADQAPDSVPVGTNLHFVAKVGRYDPVSGLFRLEPVATTVR